MTNGAISLPGFSAKATAGIVAPMQTPNRPDPLHASAVSKPLLALLAIAAAALVANLYYAQPLIGSIGPQLGLAPGLAGSIVSVTQVGYGIGLFFLVPLADLVENKTLVLVALTLTAASLVLLGLSQSAVLFFLASFIMGVCSAAAQVLLPFVAELVPPARRGRVLGNVMACVLAGIMLARPVALFLSGSFGWRSVFLLSAALLVLIGLSLARMMPRYRPAGTSHYSRVLASMLRLLAVSPVLRRRSLYQCLMFGAFNLFWTAAPIMLAARFGLSERGIALFALAGAGGALAAPFAGRLADRGLVRAATLGSVTVLGLAFAATGWAAAGAGLVALVILAMLIDAAVQTTQVVSQRIVFAVPPHVRGRVNGVYMTCLFVGGAAGSLAGTVSLHLGGWPATAAVGACTGLVLLLAVLTERRDRPERIDTAAIPAALGSRLDG